MNYENLNIDIDYFMKTKIFSLHPMLTSDQTLFKSLNITEKQFQLFYIDFIEHFFPTVFISFISFKDYLGKYGFKIPEKWIRRLYNSFLRDTFSFKHIGHDLLYEELLLGLAHIDPQCMLYRISP